MSAVLQEIITLMTSGITQLASGIGGGLKALVEAVFLKVSTGGEVTGLSEFGGIIVVFAGIALAIGLSRFVMNWVITLGGRK